MRRPRLEPVQVYTQRPSLPFGSGPLSRFWQVCGPFQPSALKSLLWGGSWARNPPPFCSPFSYLQTRVILGSLSVWEAEVSWDQGEMGPGAIVTPRVTLQGPLCCRVLSAHLCSSICPHTDPVECVHTPILQVGRLRHRAIWHLPWSVHQSTVELRSGPGWPGPTLRALLCRPPAPVPDWPRGPVGQE